MAEELAFTGQSDAGCAVRITEPHVPQLHEAVHALVHPRVIAFVAGQDAVEPVVAHLVRDHVVQAFGIAHVADDGDHRIFHAAARADGAIHRRAGVVRVFAHPLAVAQHALVERLDPHGLPFLRVLRGEEGPGGHRAATPGQHHLSLADDEAFVGEPGEVMHVVLHVAQGLHLRGGDRELVVARFAGPQVGDGFRVLPFRGGHAVHQGPFLFVLEEPRSAHYIVRGQGDRHIVAAELTVELALGEVGHGVPAAPVEHRGLGEPLGDVVGLPGMAQPREFAVGDLHAEGRGDGDGTARGKRSGQLHPADVRVLRMVAPGQGAVVREEVEAVDPATFGLGGEVQVEVAHVGQLAAQCAAPVAIGVGPEVQPDGI